MNTNKNNNNSKYYKYLKSPEWKVKTIQIKSIYNNKCAICQSLDNLNVHHITYRHLYYEPLTDLILLCKPCHTLIHRLFQLYLDSMDTVNGRVNDWYTYKCRHRVTELIYDTLIDLNINIQDYNLVKEYCKMISALVIVSLNEHISKHHINVKVQSLPEITAELFNMLNN